MPNTEIITKLLARHDTWRGQSQKPIQRSVSSGNDQIDLLLKGGWPTAALTELLVQRPGIGELSLLLPTIRDYCQNNHLSVWLDPPYQPYAPALAACPPVVFPLAAHPKGRLTLCFTNLVTLMNTSQYLPPPQYNSWMMDIMKTYKV